MSKTNGINVFFGKEHMTVNAEVSFNVQDHPAELSLVIQKLLLDQLDGNNAPKLPIGKYRLSLTMVASNANVVEEEERDEVPESEDL